MNLTRACLAHLARFLLLLVLFNGLACAVGHGQMLQPLFAASGDGHMGDMPGMAAMDGMDGMAARPVDSGEPMPGMHSPFGDCFFAGSMPLGLIAFALIGWLLRHREARPAQALPACAKPPRAALSQLNPRAP